MKRDISPGTVLHVI